MIRLFAVLFKTNFNHVPRGIELFNIITSLSKVLSAACPDCNTRGYVKEHDSYCRYLIDYDGCVQEHRVDVKRVICGICGYTHAVLPDVLVPYKSYCIIFILRVLKEYFHTKAVTAICKKYGIAPSTLYAWRDRYLSQSLLALGAATEAALLTDTRWFTSASDICRTDAPSGFFQRFGFSFLQYKKTTIFSSA